MANRRMSGSSDLPSAQVCTLTREAWIEAREKSDEIHVVQHQARTGGSDD